MMISGGMQCVKSSYTRPLTSNNLRNKKQRGLGNNGLLFSFRERSETLTSLVSVPPQSWKQSPSETPPSRTQG